MRKLFASTNETSSLPTTGYCDWKYASRDPNRHEISQSHIAFTMKMAARKRAKGQIDKNLKQQQDSEKSYWKSILERILSVIKFLASRGLGFRGKNELIRSSNNGNYLGILELIAELWNEVVLQ